MINSRQHLRTREHPTSRVNGGFGWFRNPGVRAAFQTPPGGGGWWVFQSGWEPLGSARRRRRNFCLFIVYILFRTPSFNEGVGVWVLWKCVVGLGKCLCPPPPYIHTPAPSLKVVLHVVHVVFLFVGKFPSFPKMSANLKRVVGLDQCGSACLCTELVQS